jgi:hypothetical protein
VDVAFSYSMPVSKNPITIHGVGSSATNELNPNNNLLQYTPSLKFPSFSIANHTVSGSIDAANSHCTGQGLISYFECELFPSSISGHVATFNSDGTISFTDEPNYGGSWQQSNTATQQMSFQYTENGSVIASFSGYGSIANCFDGMTTFPNSIYVSPYRVCF